MTGTLCFIAAAYLAVGIKMAFTKFPGGNWYVRLIIVFLWWPLTAVFVIRDWRAGR